MHQYITPAISAVKFRSYARNYAANCSDVPRRGTHQIVRHAAHARQAALKLSTYHLYWDDDIQILQICDENDCVGEGYAGARNRCATSIANDLSAKELEAQQHREKVKGAIDQGTRITKRRIPL
jgi:hypothetical protein